MSFTELSETVFKAQFPKLGMIQRFIKCNGTRPAIIRLFLINQTKDGRATHALSICNTELTATSSHAGACLVQEDEEDGVQVMNLQASATGIYVHYGNQVVALLEAYYAVRVEQIVLDFIRDERDTVWLVGCKGFCIDETVLFAHESKLLLSSQLSKQQLQDLELWEREQKLAELHCKICGLPYRSSDVRNLLPYKLLLLYRLHTSRTRKSVLDLSHLRAVNADLLVHSVRLCNICYLVILAEHELMKTETALAAVFNIQVPEYDVLRPLEYTYPTYMPGKLTQWRVLFYFQDVTVPKQRDWELRYELYGSRYRQKLQTSMGNFAHLYYFFVVDSDTARTTNANLEVKFQVVSKEQTLLGSVRPFRCFLFRSRRAGFQTIVIDLFSGASIQGFVKLVVGLTQDGEGQATNIPANLSRFQDLYVPDRHYFTCDPLPDEWMEVFQSGYRPKPLLSTEVTAAEDEEMPYTPNLRVTPGLRKSEEPVHRFVSTGKTSTIPKMKLVKLKSSSQVPSPKGLLSSRGRQSRLVQSTENSPRFEPVTDPSVDDCLTERLTQDIYDSSSKDQTTELRVSVERFLHGKPMPSVVRLHDKIKTEVSSPPEQPTGCLSNTDLSPVTSMSTIELLPRPAVPSTMRKSVSHHRLTPRTPGDIVKIYSSRG